MGKRVIKPLHHGFRTDGKVAYCDFDTRREAQNRKRRFDSSGIGINKRIEKKGDKFRLIIE